MLYRVVLRNYVAQTAIDQAEKGDYSEVKRVLALLQKPFDDGPTTANSDVTTTNMSQGELASSTSSLSSVYFLT